MHRTALVTLIAAGLVAAGAGPSFAAKPPPPAPAPAPNYSANVDYISAFPEIGKCSIGFSASFTSPPSTLPTEWRLSFSTSKPVTKVSKNAIVSGVADDGSSSGHEVSVGAGGTVYVAYAPVYGTTIGTPVTSQATCVL